MCPVTAGRSYWMESVPGVQLSELSGDVETDVCVVGGGITGLLCALELVEEGREVVVLEGDRVASAVTGFTTAKLTSQHGPRYRRLTDELGAGAARAYGRANEEALDRIRQVAADLDIGSDVQVRDAYVYATSPESLEALHAEADAAQEAGLPASFTTAVPVPFPTAGAVRFTDQAQIHPRSLLVPLASHLRERGVRIFESSEASAVDHDERWRVSTENGTVSADHVVLASLTPVAGAGEELWERLYCHQGFAVAMPLRGDGPGGVLISYERPMRSLRTIEHDGDRLLQVGGGAYVEDPSSGATPYDDLEAWAQEHFDVGPAEYRWSTQDYSTADGVPLVGTLDARGLYIATGFGGWGMTTAGVAAAIVRDKITARPADEERDRIFDPGRELPAVDDALISARTSSGTDADAHERIRDLAPGQATVVRHEGQQLGVYREPGGRLDVVSAICTHAGCVVLWDQDTTRWSCPCHGSQFEPDGSVVHGPAETPLQDRRSVLDG